LSTTCQDPLLPVRGLRVIAGLMLNSRSKRHPEPLASLRPTTATSACWVRAYAYLRLLGAQGLCDSAIHAVLNANYLRVLLRDSFRVPFDRTCMHAFSVRVASRTRLSARSISASG
jgi:glycine cleavage system protein P-like pyridoxal-binding family